MVLETSRKYFRKFRSNKIVLFRYSAYLFFSIFTWPFRKFANIFDDSEKRYSSIVNGKKEVQAEILGSQMIFPTSDRGLSKELLLDGIREANVVDVMRKELKDGMIVADIGANLGYYTLLEAKKAKKVYAIEPNPLALGYLKRNIALNKCKNVVIWNMGVGENKGSVPFILDNRWNLSRVSQGDDPGVKTRDIKVDSIDNLFKNKKLDFMRMDVEGYELQILKGAKEVIKKNPQILIFLEFHADILDSQKREEFISLCRGLNLRIKHFFKKDQLDYDAPHSKTFRAVRNASPTAYHLLLEVGK